jgi:hypothetical protein
MLFAGDRIYVKNNGAPNGHPARFTLTGRSSIVRLAINKTFSLYPAGKHKSTLREVPYQGVIQSPDKRGPPRSRFAGLGTLASGRWLLPAGYSGAGPG